MAELGGYGLAALGENEVEGWRRPGGVKRPAKFAFNLAGGFGMLNIKSMSLSAVLAYRGRVNKFSTHG
jgi:hypothetical protein